MGENRVNCIYIDEEGKWWLAESEDALGEKEILLIEEKTEELKEGFDEKYFKFITSIAPHIIYPLEGMVCGTDARGRKVIYPTK